MVHVILLENCGDTYLLHVGDQNNATNVSIIIYVIVFFKHIYTITKTLYDKITPKLNKGHKIWVYICLQTIL